MIKSFASDEAEKLWQGARSRRFPPDIQKRAVMKLQLIDAAVELAFKGVGQIMEELTIRSKVEGLCRDAVAGPERAFIESACAKTLRRDSPNLQPVLPQPLGERKRVSSVL